MCPRWCCMRVCSGPPTGATRRGRSNGKGGKFRSLFPARPDRRNNDRNDKPIAMVLLTRKIEFAASHLYHNPDFSPEENRRVFGKCNNPHGHAHNYTLEVTVAGEPDPVTGMVLDLKDLKVILEREVMQRMDHRFLNYEVPELAGQIPTCENIARVIWQLLDPKIKQAKLHRVRLYETPDLFADCYRNGSEGADGR